ncbi:MAG: glycoside hydrolase family 1 protein [Candidatus Doudnabacteria bacterium]|nr:glycoside hydrolase family 1 protein [Candidatus Doudnabacteria bacterium]
MPKQKLFFPKDFLWGASTSGHQTEGNNTNSDWWAFEHSQRREAVLKAAGKNIPDYQSGIACDSYNRYDEDFALAQHLNHNATRIGIEWARIEPEEGKFSEKELAHYEKVLQSAKFHGLQTFVTLHHYTLPKWLADKGGFLNPASVGLFARYVSAVSRRLNQYTDFWLTINEPEVYATHSYLLGRYPPKKKSLFKTLKVVNNLVDAHNQAAKILKFETGKPVSMAYQLSDLEPSGFFSHFTHFLAEYLANEYIINRTIGTCDFIGVNYYIHHHIGFWGIRKHSHSKHEQNDLGWGIHPDGLERLLVNLKKHNKPIYITENGIADSKDIKREKFIKDHLYHVHCAIQKGVDVRGYLYWSLIDNFEWLHGFWPRFGLVEIDREDLLRRKVRYSALKYAEICRTNCLEVDASQVHNI